MRWDKIQFKTDLAELSEVLQCYITTIYEKLQMLVENVPKRGHLFIMVIPTAGLVYSTKITIYHRY